MFRREGEVTYGCAAGCGMLWDQGAQEEAVDGGDGGGSAMVSEREGVRRIFVR